MLVVPADELRWSPAARPILWRQRPRARCPHRRLRQDTGDIAQRERADAGAQVCVAAITRVHQHHAARKAGRAGPAQLLDRDLWLGLEADVLRNARFAPALTVLRPVLRQIQPIDWAKDRQRRRKA